MDQLLTRRDAAQRVALSLRAFETYVQPNVRLVRIGAAVRVPESEIARWIEREMKRAS